MKSKAKLLVVLVVIVSIGLAACAVTPAAPTPVPPTATPVPPTPAPGITVEELIGLWYDADRNEYLQINEDGTYRVAVTLGFLEADPYEVGQYRLEGTSFTFVTSDDSADCAGQSGNYQVELTEQDQLQLLLQEDACQVRADEQPGAWERVPPITVENMIGIWRSPGGDSVQFNEDGTYRQAPAPALETAPREVGQFQIEGTVITFLTDEGRACGGGQSGSYQVELTEPDLFQLVLQEDACQSRANYYPGTWNRVETTPSITQEDLIRIWTGHLTVGTDRIEYVFQFNEDDTWRGARAADLLDCCPAMLGQFQLEGTLLTFITSDESSFCKDQTGAYEVELTEKDQLQFVLSEDPCSSRTSIVDEPWTRVSP